MPVFRIPEYVTIRNVNDLTDRLSRPTTASVRKTLLWTKERKSYEREYQERSLIKDTALYWTKFRKLSKHYPGTRATSKGEELDQLVSRLTKPTVVSDIRQSARNYSNRVQKSKSSEKGNNRDVSSRRSVRTGAPVAHHYQVRPTTAPELSSREPHRSQCRSNVISIGDVQHATKRPATSYSCTNQTRSVTENKLKRKTPTIPIFPSFQNENNTGVSTGNDADRCNIKYAQNYDDIARKHVDRECSPTATEESSRNQTNSEIVDNASGGRLHRRAPSTSNDSSSALISGYKEDNPGTETIIHLANNNAGETMTLDEERQLSDNGESVAKSTDGSSVHYSATFDSDTDDEQLKNDPINHKENEYIKQDTRKDKTEEVSSSRNLEILASEDVNRDIDNVTPDVGIINSSSKTIEDDHLYYANRDNVYFESDSKSLLDNTSTDGQEREGDSTCNAKQIDDDCGSKASDLSCEDSAMPNEGEKGYVSSASHSDHQMDEGVNDNDQINTVPLIHHHEQSIHGSQLIGTSDHMDATETTAVSSSTAADKIKENTSTQSLRDTHECSYSKEIPNESEKNDRETDICIQKEPEIQEKISCDYGSNVDIDNKDSEVELGIQNEDANDNLHSYQENSNSNSISNDNKITSTDQKKFQTDKDRISLISTEMQRVSNGNINEGHGNNTDIDEEKCFVIQDVRSGGNEGTNEAQPETDAMHIKDIQCASVSGTNRTSTPLSNISDCAQDRSRPISRKSDLPKINSYAHDEMGQLTTPSDKVSTKQTYKDNRTPTPLMNISTHASPLNICSSHTSLKHRSSVLSQRSQAPSLRSLQREDSRPIISVPNPRTPNTELRKGDDFEILSEQASSICLETTHKSPNTMRLPSIHHNPNCNEIIDQPEVNTTCDNPVQESNLYDYKCDQSNGDVEPNERDTLIDNEGKELELRQNYDDESVAIIDLGDGRSSGLSTIEPRTLTDSMSDIFSFSDRPSSIDTNDDVQLTEDLLMPEHRLRLQNSPFHKDSTHRTPREKPKKKKVPTATLR